MLFREDSGRESLGFKGIILGCLLNFCADCCLGRKSVTVVPAYAVIVFFPFVKTTLRFISRFARVGIAGGVDFDSWRCWWAPVQVWASVVGSPVCSLRGETTTSAGEEQTGIKPGYNWDNFQASAVTSDKSGKTSEPRNPDVQLSCRNSSFLFFKLNGAISMRTVTSIRSRRANLIDIYLHVCFCSFFRVPVRVCVCSLFTTSHSL